MKDIEKLLKPIRDRRKERKAASLDGRTTPTWNADKDDIQWITTENGSHIPLNSEKKAVGGPLKGESFKSANTSKASASKSTRSAKEKIPEKELYNIDLPKQKVITKRKANEKIDEVYERIKNQKDWDDSSSDEVASVLDSLEPGSVILCHGGSQYDTTFKIRKNKDGRWEEQDNVGVYNGMTFTSKDISYEFLVDKEDGRPEIIKSAESAEDIEKWRQKSYNSHFRNQKLLWENGGRFSDTEKVKLYEQDIKSLGDGYEVKGTNGKTYVKYYGEWWEKRGEEEADDNVRNLKTIGCPTFEGDFYDVRLGTCGMSKKSCDSLRKRMDSFDSATRKVYENKIRSTEYVPDSQGRTFYNHGSIHLSNGDDESTFFHETAHAIDDDALDMDITLEDGYVRHFSSASDYIDHLSGYLDGRRKDFESMAKVVGIKTNGNGWFDDSIKDDYAAKIDSYFKFARKYKNLENFSAVSDCISALTLNSMGETMFGGHDTDYWQRNYGYGTGSPRSSEYWANYCSLRARNRTEELELLKQLTPITYDACEKTYKEVFK